MPPNIPEHELRGYLRDEYLMLQGNFEDFDRRALSIKGWVASGTLAALALSFQAPNYASVISSFAIVLALTFWCLETTWKVFQKAFRDRIRIIEAYFRGDPDILMKHPPAFQSYASWSSSFKNDEPIYPYESEPPAPKRPGAAPRRDAAPVRPKSRTSRFLSSAWHPFVCLPYVVIVVLSVVAMWLAPQRPAKLWSVGETHPHAGVNSQR